MNLLITSSEVAEIAFGGEDNVVAGVITDAAILASQKRYIKPVLGGKLYVALQDGQYSALLSDWIKPALALYVKYSVLPALSAQTGALGVVRYAGSNFDPADSKSLIRLLKRIRMDADALMDAAVEYIVTDPAAFPEYDEKENVKNSISIVGGIVL